MSSHEGVQGQRPLPPPPKQPSGSKSIPPPLPTAPRPPSTNLSTSRPGFAPLSPCPTLRRESKTDSPRRSSNGNGSCDVEGLSMNADRAPLPSRPVDYDLYGVTEVPVEVDRIDNVIYKLENPEPIQLEKAEKREVSEKVQSLRQLLLENYAAYRPATQNNVSVAEPGGDELRKRRFAPQIQDVEEESGRCNQNNNEVDFGDQSVHEYSSCRFMRGCPLISCPDVSEYITMDDLYDYWAAEGSATVFLWAWALWNIALASYAAYMNWGVPNYYWTLAKTCAATLNLNCVLILICVARMTLTKVRGFAFARKYLPLDHWLQFHKIFAYAVAIAGAGHTLGHYLDYISAPNGYVVGWYDLYGATGHIISLCMIFMYTSAVPSSLRQHSYAIFHWNHRLYIVFYLCLLLHSRRFYYYFTIPGLIFLSEKILSFFRSKPFMNVVSVSILPSDVINVNLNKSAQFDYKPGQYLFLNCPSISEYEWHPFTITSSPENPDNLLSVHIYCKGDWTQGLRFLTMNMLEIQREKLRALEEKEANGVDSTKNERDTWTSDKRMTRVSLLEDDGGSVYSDSRITLEEEGSILSSLLRVDGPYGAASQDVFDYEILVLVGAGIGVTPFASILRTIWHRLRVNAHSVKKIKKIYFFWIIRHFRAFEWFQGLLSDLFEELKVKGQEDLLEVFVFVTGAATYVIDAPFPILSGRPDFNGIFRRLRNIHNKRTVGVFFCGPKVLGNQLDDLCREYSKDYATFGTIFKWHQETF